jgi:hypothetical protein
MQGQFVQVIEERQGLKWVVLKKLLGGKVLLVNNNKRIWLSPEKIRL